MLYSLSAAFINQSKASSNTKRTTQQPKHIAKTNRRPQEIYYWRLINLKANKNCLRQSGGHSKLEPPGPIPNPEVKRLCADGSWTIGPVRVGRRQFYMPLLSEN